MGPIIRGTCKSLSVLCRGILLATGLAALAAHAGLRYNQTPSVPKGLYWINPFDRSAPVGSYAAFCPPLNDIVREAKRRGYLGNGPCPGNLPALLKVVAAGPGDLVEIRDDGVHINGHLWPKSRPLERDPEGRKLPQQQGLRVVLNHHERLFLSQNQSSGFDCRYLGPVPDRHMMGTAY